MAAGIDVKVTGPMFKKGGRIVNQVTEKFVQTMVELGEERLATKHLLPRPRGEYLSAAQAGENASVGHYLKNLTGTTQGMRGRIDDGNVIYGPWLEFGDFYQGGRFRGYASFRKTSQWMQKQVSVQARRFVNTYVRRLEGR